MGGSQPATKKQKAYIQRLLRAFPDARELLEYEDYLKNQTQESASEFIRQAREDFAVPMSQRENYLDYVSHRPGVELRGEHGLWTSGGKVENLSEAVREVAEHPGNVWTPVVAIRRQDAERLGYDNAENWRALVNASLCDIAKGYKIHPDHLRWYAAFHEKEKSVHIHMVVFSSDPKEGYLTPDGIRQVKSAFARRIFQQGLMHIYEQKTAYRNQLQQNAAEAMQELIRQMRDGSLENPQLEDQIEALARRLRTVRGKKVYGYLKKPVKARVDAIVDELARLPEVAECYEQWNRMRDELEGYYKDSPREHLPLSQQQEFKAIKNMVIWESEELRLGVFTFEDASMRDEVDEDQAEVYYAWSSRWEMAAAYQNAKEILSEYENTEAEKVEQVQVLEQLWGAGFTVAAHQLGKCWRDGMGVLPDDEQAELWFRRAAEAGHDFSQYALGKLLQSQKRMNEAVSWYEKAAAQGGSWAAYRLGKVYLEGRDIPKETAKAVEYLTNAAQEGNQYAQYTLGKLYLTGEDATQDREQAYHWLWESASQGNKYAQFFLEHFRDNHSPNVLLSATKLLHHLGRIFQENSVPPVAPVGHGVDRKLRQKIRAKKIAMGHKADDHEDPELTQSGMGGMTGY